MPASAKPDVAHHLPAGRGGGASAAAVDAVVAMVRVAVAGAALVRLTGLVDPKLKTGGN